MMERGISPAPMTIPAEIAQNKNAMSRGSLMAALKRTIERAPTIPRDKTRFDVTARIIRVVIMVIAMMETPKDAEYMTPA